MTLLKRNKYAYKINFVKGSSQLPFVWIKIHETDEWKLAIVDSGSEITLMDREFADTLAGCNFFKTRKEGEIHLEGIGGKTGKTTASPFICVASFTDTDGNERMLPLHGTITDLSSMKATMKQVCPAGDTVMIIGSDTLHELKAKIDFKNKVVILHDIFSDKES